MTTIKLLLLSLVVLVLFIETRKLRKNVQKKICIKGKPTKGVPPVKSSSSITKPMGKHQICVDSFFKTYLGKVIGN